MSIYSTNTHKKVNTYQQIYSYKLSLFRSLRKKRQVPQSPQTKQAYQALVTNCQDQSSQGPSIMVVANKGDVQFAIKTYKNDPAVVSVPAVSMVGNYRSKSHFSVICSRHVEH